MARSKRIPALFAVYWDPRMKGRYQYLRFQALGCSARAYRFEIMVQKPWVEGRIEGCIVFWTVCGCSLDRHLAQFLSTLLLAGFDDLTPRSGSYKLTVPKLLYFRLWNDCNFAGVIAGTEASEDSSHQ